MLTLSDIPSRSINKGPHTEATERMYQRLPPLITLAIISLCALVWFQAEPPFQVIGIGVAIALGAVVILIFQHTEHVGQRNLELTQLRSSLNDFTRATTPQEIFDALIRASTTALQTLDRDAVVSLVGIEVHQWEIAHSSHPRGEGLRGSKRIERALESLFGYSHAPHEWQEERQSHELEGRFLNAFPVPLGEGHKATLVVDSNRSLTPEHLDAIAGFCQQTSLASHAIVQKVEDIEYLQDMRFKILLQHAPDAVFVTDLLGHSLFANAMGDNILHDVGNARSLFGMIHPDDRPAFVSLVQNAPHSNNYDDANHIECRLASTGAEVRWLEISALDMSDDAEIKGIVINTRDITQRKLLEHDLRHRITHDELTGIPNLAFFKERAEFALAFRRSDHSVAATLYIGLTNIDALTSLLGASAIDDVQKIIAFRLDNYVRGHDTPARVTNHTFAVLLQDVRSEADINNITMRLLEVLQRPIEFDGRDIALSVAIGICVAQPDYTVDTFLRNAEVALHEAKQSHTQVATYSGSMAVEAGERVNIRRDLAEALGEDQFVVNYQPLIELGTSRLCGFEALLRWEHPVRGTVSPGLFIPIAEESGLINDIGSWVTKNACAQLATWHSAYPDKLLQIHINVSNRQLAERDLVQRLQRVLETSGVNPAAVIFEMTESRSLYEPQIRERLHQLRALGVGIATDEFGGTFNSYAVLRDLPITTVKIDRSLILSLDTNFQKANAQLRKLIEMAHAANVIVIAEGIENEAQRDALAEMGADRAQGYFFGRPVPAPSVSSFLATSTHLVATS